MLAKNFLMSHFNTQTVLVLLFDNFRQYFLSLSIARCVPLLNLQEYESKINFGSKYGYKIR